MGAANSCSYSDLVIRPIDKAVIDAQRTRFQEISYFGRYKRDCITIWTEDGDKIELSREFLNSLDKNITFTVEIGGKSLSFLNLKITIDDKKHLSSVYSKPTDSHLYLYRTSCYPTKSIDKVSTGVAQGLKRLCSNDSEFLEQSKKYSAYLAA